MKTGSNLVDYLHSLLFLVVIIPEHQEDGEELAGVRVDSIDEDLAESFDANLSQDSFAFQHADSQHIDQVLEILIDIFLMHQDQIKETDKHADFIGFSLFQ